MRKSSAVQGCYYGINRQTLEVERVVRRADGFYTLSRGSVIEVRLFLEPVGPKELRYLFDLRETRYVPADEMGTPHEYHIHNSLCALAEQYRQEAA